jgi:hypothetical protein
MIAGGCVQESKRGIEKASKSRCRWGVSGRKGGGKKGEIKEVAVDAV